MDDHEYQPSTQLLAWYVTVADEKDKLCDLIVSQGECCAGDLYLSCCVNRSSAGYGIMLWGCFQTHTIESASCRPPHGSK